MKIFVKGDTYCVCPLSDGGLEDVGVVRRGVCVSAIRVGSYRVVREG